MTKGTVIRAKGLALYCIPKNANSSMRRAVLAGLGHDEAAQGDHHHTALNLSPVQAYPEFRACFLRNPLDRLVSCWADKIARRKPGGTAHLERLGYQVGMPFREFAHMAAELHDQDPHTRSQLAFVVRPMSCTGCVETIGADWGFLQRQCPWLPSLPLSNASMRAESTFDGYYDRPTRRLIERTYADDLHAWEQALNSGFGALNA